MSDALIKIELETRPFLRAWNSLVRDQIPFATAKALTSVAKAAQRQVKRELPRRFTLRSTWVQRGIRIKPARKADWPRPYALVGSRDEFMVDQETGGTRRARGKYRAVPTRLVRRRASGAVRKPDQPRQLIGRNRAHFGDRSIVRNKTRRSRAGAKVMYFLRESTQLKPRMGMVKTVEKVARRRLQPTFNAELTRALRTARARTR